MHIIARKALRQFWEKYPASQNPLSRWYKVVSNSKFSSFNDPRAMFPSAEKVGNLIVFNIGCNKYRLIASIHFNRGKVYIRHVLRIQNMAEEHGKDEYYCKRNAKTLAGDPAHPFNPQRAGI